MSHAPAFLAKVRLPAAPGEEAVDHVQQYQEQQGFDHPEQDTEAKAQKNVQQPPCHDKCEDRYDRRNYSSQYHM